jgi:chromosome segregation ATPase
MSECAVAWVDDYGKDHECFDDPGHRGGHECGCGARVPQHLLAEVERLRAESRTRCRHTVDEWNRIDLVERLRGEVAETRRRLAAAEASGEAAAQSYIATEAMRLELDRRLVPAEAEVERLRGELADVRGELLHRREHDAALARRVAAAALRMAERLWNRHAIGINEWPTRENLRAWADQFEAGTLTLEVGRDG